MSASSLPTSRCGEHPGRARGTGELSRKPARVLFQPSRQTGRGLAPAPADQSAAHPRFKDPDIQALASHAPILLDVLGDASKQHFEAVRRPPFGTWRAKRGGHQVGGGLDYYTGHHLRGEGQDRRSGRTEHAGRRRAYDRLVSSLGGPEVPAIASASGVERVLLALAEPAEEFEPVLALSSQCWGTKRKPGPCRWRTGLRLRGVRTETRTSYGQFEIAAQARRRA